MTIFHPKHSLISRVIRKRNGDPDLWMTDEDRIGDRAKKEILEKAVAFANAYGGALLLGIRESDTKPPVASAITPIPRCKDLAERLKLVFRDCVEPQLPRSEIVGVPTQDDSGVVVIRVGKSRLAPHRVTTTLVCPIRRQDRCEKMTMREIQDMTLNVSRGLECLDRRLSERSERFQREEFKRLATPEDAFGIRLTAAPVGDEIRIDRIYHDRDLVERFKGPWHSLKCNKEISAPWPSDAATSSPKTAVLSLERLWPKEARVQEPIFWRPILRGARADHFEIISTLPLSPLLCGTISTAKSTVMV